MEAWWEAPLESLSAEQWEALCDGCGRCCLYRLEDAATGELVYTNVACAHLDQLGGGCDCYASRQTQVPDCIDLRADYPASLRTLPRSCAYRLRAAGKPLPSWHPLVSGDPHSVSRSGHSIIGRSIPAGAAGELHHHLMADWD